MQNRIIRDASRSAVDKRQARTLRREAEAQLRLLTEIDGLTQSDFYSYRYFATEGFLPGYSFPRLPISAFIPGRRIRQRDEFLSRPRFLAITEFGPRAIIYHEGSRYLINQIIMPADGDDDELLTTQVKQCGNCGYLHPVETKRIMTCASAAACRSTHRCNRCSVCRTWSRAVATGSTRTKRSGCAWAMTSAPACVCREGRSADGPNRAWSPRRKGKASRLTYAPTATLWRINLGWARRKNKNRHGFVLDIERGYWARNEQVEDDPDDPISAHTRWSFRMSRTTATACCLSQLMRSGERADGVTAGGAQACY